MEILKRIINKHKSFSLATLVALVMMTGITACKSCNTKPNTDGKPAISFNGSTNDLHLQDKGPRDLEENRVRTVKLSIDLDQDSKDKDQAAIYENYELKVEVTEGNGSLEYDDYDQDKNSTKCKVEKGTAIQKTLDHFIAGAKNGTLENAHEVVFTFAPDATDKEMKATFVLIDANTKAEIGTSLTAIWKEFEAKNLQLEEAKQAKANLIAAKGTIENLKKDLDTLNAEEKVKLKEIIGKAVNIETEAKVEVAKINDIAAQLAGNKEGEEAIKTIQIEAQDSLTAIEALRKEIEAIVLTKNAEVFLEQVQEAEKAAQAELTKVNTALGKNTEEGLVEAEAAVKAAAEAAKVAEEGLDKLKGTAHAAAAKTAVDAAKQHAADAKRAYDDVIEEANWKAILQQVQDAAQLAKEEANKVGPALGIPDFAAALAAVKEAEAALKLADEAAKKLAGTPHEGAAQTVVTEAQSEVTTKAREAFDTHPEAKSYVILEQVQEAEKAAQAELTKVNTALGKNTEGGLVEAEAAVKAAAEAAKVADEAAKNIAEGTAHAAAAKTAVDAAKQHAADAKQAYDDIIKANVQAALQYIQDNAQSATEELDKVGIALGKTPEADFEEALTAVKAAEAAAKSAEDSAKKFEESDHEAAVKTAATAATVAAAARTAADKAKADYIAAVTPKIQELLTEFNGDDKGVSVVAKQIAKVRDTIEKKHTKKWYTGAKKAIETAKIALQAAKNIVDELAQVAIAEDEAQKEASTKVGNAKEELNKVIDELNTDAKNHSVTTSAIENVK